MIQLLINQRQWERLVGHNKLFSYKSFLAAALPHEKRGFLVSGNEEDNARELVAFLAHVAYKTLRFTRTGDPTDTTEKNETSYHPRGPFGLEGEKEYAEFSQFYYGAESVLLDDPERLSTLGILAFSSAIWKWFNRSTETESSPHRLMYRHMGPKTNWGFGQTIRSLWGVPETETMVKQCVGYYEEFAKVLNVKVGENEENIYPPGWVV